MNYITRLLLISGLGATLIGGFDMWLLLRGTSEPEKITLAALGAEDGTSNVHLSISNFRFGEYPIADNNEHGGWERVWIPLLLPDDTWTKRPVIVHTNKFTNQFALDNLYKRTKLTGVITNGMQGLGNNHKKLFAKNYPAIDLNGAIVFEIDRKFPSPGTTYPISLFGICLLALAAANSFGWFGKKTDNAQTRIE